MPWSCTTPRPNISTPPEPQRPLTGALPAAVLWDMDGTLVDTEPYWVAEERSLVDSARRGVDR